VTLCYWAPDEPIEAIGRQVHHAFPRPVLVRHDGVRQGDNDQGTLFVEVIDQAPLSDGLKRLYDGTHVIFPPLRDWLWHVTCVRDTRGRDVEALKRSAADLRIEVPWLFDTVSLMELRGEKYEAVETWRL
jgi:hypothetical protein